MAAFIDAGYQGLPRMVTIRLPGFIDAIRHCSPRAKSAAARLRTPEQKLILENGLLERSTGVAQRRTPVDRRGDDLSERVRSALPRKTRSDGVVSDSRRSDARKIRRVEASARIRRHPLDDAPPCPETLQAVVVAALVNRPDRGLLETMILRSMMQAAVTARRTSAISVSRWRRYMHFTSPIRRYADLVVHRAIAGVLSRDRIDQSHLEEVGEHLSVTERRADDVSREACRLAEVRICGAVRRRTHSTALWSRSPTFGVFVELERIFIQGLLHVSNLGDDYFQFYPAAMSLVGERSGRRIKLGDKLS